MQIMMARMGLLVGYCASFSTFQKDLQDLRSAAKFEVKL
jgi:hypothetical protein